MAYTSALPASAQLRKRDPAHGAVVLLLSGALAIALAPILVRMSELAPVPTAFFRLALSVPILGVGVWLDARPSRRHGLAADSARRECRHPWRHGALMALCGLLLAGDLALWHTAITLTSVANATLFNNCAPIFVAAFAWVVLKERMGVGLVVALLTAILGMALLMSDGLRLGGDQQTGDLLAVLTAAFYAGYLLLVKYLRQFHSTSLIMAGSSLAAALAVLVVSLIEGGNLLPVTLYGWAVVIGLGLVCHVGGQGLITAALAHLPASFSSIGLLLQPVMATVLAWVLFGEALSLAQVAGMLFVLAGIILARRAANR